MREAIWWWADAVSFKQILFALLFELENFVNAFGKATSRPLLFQNSVV